MKKTALEGVHYWSRYQPDRHIDFNGFFWARPAGNVLFDPLEMDEHELGFVEQQGGARWILLTNFDHLRAALVLKEALGARVVAPAGDRGRFGTGAGGVDRWFETAEELPDALAEDLEVHALRGGKSPVEIAFFLKPVGGLLFGDLVRSHVSGRLNLLPPEKLQDPAAAYASLRTLRELPVEGLLLGDGDCVFHGAAALFRALVDGLPGA